MQSMKVELQNEEIPKLVKALEHYYAYLVAVQREDHSFKEIAERLKKVKI